VRLGSLARPSAEQLREMRTDLVDMGVRTVRVRPEPRRDEVVDLFKGILGRDRQATGGVDLWWGS
jgi:hypothetical protein